MPKQTGKLQVRTTQRWLGKSRARTSLDVFGPSQQSRVHRIKIDTAKLLLVMTEEANSGDAHLTVYSLGPGRPMLFQLEQVSTLAHVEMSNGFVVFTCGDSNVLEVWRWAQDQEVDLVPQRPEMDQLNVYYSAMQKADFQPGSGARRGELIPMGVLRQPADLRATRLVYPTLCVGARAGDRLWLWDIRTRQLTQTITIEPSPFEAFGMLYVDVNETHVFVATHTVSVYSRSTGQCVFQLRDSQLEGLTHSASYPTLQQRSHSVFLEYAWESYRELYRSSIVLTIPSDIVMAVHVSPTGDDFVAITFRGFIFHIGGLKEATAEHEMSIHEGSSDAPSPGSLGASVSASTSSSRSPNEISLDKFRISVARGGTGLDNLAYDGNRIVADGGQGLCIINLEPQPEEIFTTSINEKQIDLYPFPAKFLNRVPPFGSEQEEYGDCTCIQITQEAIWIAWQPYLRRQQEDLQSERKAVGMILFSEGEEEEEV
ncbi:F-box protein [Ceratobasidium sp. AG-Ba]|nr:F-box protein [Ceratobasidium sp. AG-Ba]